MTWIDVDDVLVVAANDDLDASTGAELLVLVTAAANDWAYDQRSVAGYADTVGQAPSDRVKLGTAYYAYRLYQERSVGNGASFEGFPELPEPTVGLGTIRQLLGIRRPRVA